MQQEQLEKAGNPLAVFLLLNMMSPLQILLEILSTCRRLGK